VAGRMEGKVALISGSTRGIGRSIAELFAAQGAKIAVTGRTTEKGEKVVARIRAEGGDAEFFRLDIFDESNVESVRSRPPSSPWSITPPRSGTPSWAAP
jgi:meso-butanediol dehydrogenase/(S,S)-butanediol dehydrogenase/diacetyl reductase